jgi:hypothetical protein
MTLTGFTMNTDLSAEDPAIAPSLIAFAELAKKYKISLVAGIVICHSGMAENTLLDFQVMA